MNRVFVLSAACLMLVALCGSFANAETLGQDSLLHNKLLTNATAATQTYSYTVTLPVSYDNTNIISGSIVTSAIDGGLDGATVGAPDGKSIYNALIDGAVVKTLQTDPFAVVTPAGATSASSSFESFAWQPSLTAVNSDIGIRLDFTLTPGDTIAILSRFDIASADVPEPSTVALVLMAGVGILVCKRRRR